MTKLDIMYFLVITKLFWSACYITKANRFGYNKIESRSQALRDNESSLNMELYVFTCSVFHMAFLNY